MQTVLGVLVVLAYLSTAAAGQPDSPPHRRDGLGLDGVQQTMPKAAFGDLDAIRARRAVRVLVPYSRTSFFFERGVPRGFIHDAFQEYGRFLNRGVARSKRIRVAFIPVPRDKLIPWLVAGRGDVAAGRLTITGERSEVVDFTDPLEGGIAEIAVTRKGGVALQSVEDLAGRRVQVRPSSSYHASLTALNERFAAEGRPAVKIEPAEEYLEDEDLLELLSNGLAEIVIIDDYKQRLFARIFPDLVFNTEVRLRSNGEIGWAVRKNSPALKASLSAFIARSISGSHLLDYLEHRYFVENRWLRKPPSATETAEFEILRGYFLKYGVAYDLEWPRLLAQSYQESGLTQEARSPFGAVGLMQLMPQTASGAPILVPDIHIAEQNVHAGAKYMRHLIDTYFDEPGLAAAERFRFALAAYNAGPNRVARLRKMTTIAGLDADTWYGNVELLAARHVGQETVTYVSNIEKYFFAFQSALQLDQLRGDGFR